MNTADQDAEGQYQDIKEKFGVSREHLYADVEHGDVFSERDGYDELMDSLDDYDKVVSEGITRLGRSAPEMRDTANTLREAGVTIATISLLREFPSDEDDAMPKLFLDILTRMAEAELERLKEFVQTDDCLTRFIDDELDGSLEEDCGRCANCVGSFLPTAVQEEELVQTAVEHYRADSWETISPRYYIPEEDGRSKIEEDRKPEPGRILSTFDDPGYGELVSQQQTTAKTYSQELVSASVEHIETNWDLSPPPTWVTAIPAHESREQVTDLARRIASELGIEFIQAITQVREIQPQHELNNSFQKRWNVEGAFEATEAVRSEPVLTIDDTIVSRWTFTEASLVLRDAGSGPVYPFALAQRK